MKKICRILVVLCVLSLIGCSSNETKLEMMDVELEGESYTIPCELSKFQEAGWSYSNILNTYLMEDVILQPNQYYIMKFTKDNAAMLDEMITLTVANDTQSPMKIDNKSIVRRVAIPKRKKGEVRFYNNLTMNMKPQVVRNKFLKASAFYKEEGEYFSIAEDTKSIIVWELDNVINQIFIADIDLFQYQEYGAIDECLTDGEAVLAGFRQSSTRYLPNHYEELKMNIQNGVSEILYAKVVILAKENRQILFDNKTYNGTVYYAQTKEGHMFTLFEANAKDLPITVGEEIDVYGMTNQVIDYQGNDSVTLGVTAIIKEDQCLYDNSYGVCE